MASRRLWACAEHGVIYSAPDDATVYRDVTCPECDAPLLRYPYCGGKAFAWRLSPVD